MSNSPETPPALTAPHISSVSADLHPRPGGVPGLCQPQIKGEAAETGRTAGETWRQPQGYRPSPDQLQTKHHSSGQVLPGEGPYSDGKCGTESPPVLSEQMTNLFSLWVFEHFQHPSSRSVGSGTHRPTVAHGVCRLFVFFGCEKLSRFEWQSLLTMSFFS